MPSGRSSPTNAATDRKDLIARFDAAEAQWLREIDETRHIAKEPAQEVKRMRTELAANRETTLPTPVRTRQSEEQPRRRPGAAARESHAEASGTTSPINYWRPQSHELPAVSRRI